MPKLSVLISCYNDHQYISKSLESILNQTIRDFEVIIIDDASTDDTVDIINGYGDDRIRLYVNNENQGLTRNLNKALDYATGEYIARMDGDDISHLDRFEKQVKYLDAHKDIYLIGSAVHSFGATDLYWRLPDDSDELKIRMLLSPVFAHPSFMFRRELVDNGYRYDESFRTAQDYDFAARVSREHNIGRLQEVLLEYRVHAGQVSNKAGKNQNDNASRVRNRLLEDLGVILDEDLISFYKDWALQKKLSSACEYKKAYKIIELISQGNGEKHIYNPDKLEAVLKKMLYTWIIRSKEVKYLLAFPMICNYNFHNMGIFLAELTRTYKEKVMNKHEQRESIF